MSGLSKTSFVLTLVGASACLWVTAVGAQEPGYDAEVGPEVEPQVSSASPVSERSGLRQLGLGLEIPVVGVVTDYATGRLTYGYTLGGALSWEVLPNVLLRAYGSMGRAFGAKPHISYAQASAASSTSDVTATRRQDASWFDAEGGLGAAYLWRDAHSDLTPFLGVDGGAIFSGYEYIFAPSDPLTQQDTSGGVATHASDIHEALAWSWSATLRGGVRLSMLRWLATQAELGVTYIPASRLAVSNTYTALGVRSLGENIVLVRATFCVRLGI